MKKIPLILFTICFAALFSFAQSKPFEKFDRAVEMEKGGFDGNKENLSRIFNEERIRLGESFESELWNYLGADVEKHYWISSFLVWKDYLHGSKPLPDISFNIKERGIELIGNTDDKENLGRKITFLRDLSIASYRAGKLDRAIAYKNRAAQIYAAVDDIGAYVGATTKLDNCIYDNFEKDASICREYLTSPTEKIINGGIISGKALSLPQPKYPKEARKAKIEGEVRVRVLISVKGDIISAVAVDGPTELQEAAEEAAKKAIFSSTLLEGNPTKVSGIIVYKFVL